MNSLLLGLNLLGFLPLLIQHSDNRIFYGVGTGFVTILAFLHNIKMGLSNPANFIAFMDSMYGLWAVVLAVEFLYLLYLLYMSLHSDAKLQPPPDNVTPTPHSSLTPHSSQWTAAQDRSPKATETGYRKALMERGEPVCFAHRFPLSAQGRIRRGKKQGARLMAFFLYSAHWP